MNHKLGFSILYFMIYLVCSTLLISMMVRWHSETQSLFKQSLYYHQLLIDTYIAHDILVRDLRAAPQAKTDWIVQSPTQIIWRQKDTLFIAWIYKDNTLFRTEGVYNDKENSWHKSDSAIIVSHVDTMQFNYIEQDNSILLVRFSYSTQLNQKPSIFIHGAARTGQGVFI